jgi:hypothetical protein
MIFYYMLLYIFILEYLFLCFIFLYAVIFNNQNILNMFHLYGYTENKLFSIYKFIEVNEVILKILQYGPDCIVL